MTVRTIVAIALLAAVSVTASAATLSAQEAANHVGESATVCGTVASAKYAMSVKGQPTFLNLDEAYPHQVFTALVWGSDRKAFPNPPEALAGHRICVTGSITEHNGKAEIIVRSPDAITEK